MRNTRRYWASSIIAASVSCAAAPSSAEDASRIPVVSATSSPRVGELVLDEKGVLSSEFFEEARICTIRGCRRFIFDKRSGALILNDSVWVDAYAKTGRGDEVIRAQEFTSEENPEPAPKDDALETAPGITKVERPDTKG